MGKTTGFMEYERLENQVVSPKIRIKDFQDFHLFLNDEKRKQQASRCMNCGVPFCQSTIEINNKRTGCPLHNLIPEWNDEIYHNNDALALSRLLKTNPFPEFTGRVCPALCEKACVCGLHDEPVTIRDNELYIIENGFLKGLVEPSTFITRSQKKVAVVGSGPAGLSVAYKLNQRGHDVTVFEKEDRFGGLLMYGIPQMKLEKQVIFRRIELMQKEGIEFVSHMEIGKDMTKDELLNRFDAVVLCCGAQKARDIKVKNRECQGIYFAVDFLKSATQSLLDKCENPLHTKDKHVVIVGGGDTGNDCVATCIRQGCASVTQLEMMPQPPLHASQSWPQWPNELKVDYGQQESQAVFDKDPRLYQTTIKECLVEDDQLVAIKTVKGYMHEGKWHENKKSEEIIKADVLLIAIGFEGVDDTIIKDFSLPLIKPHHIATNKKSYQVQDDKIFIAGDMHRGQSLVVWAIAEGLECAKEVDQYLMGYSYMNE